MNQQVKTKRDFPYVTLILIVTLVLVVAILGYTFVESVGIIGGADGPTAIFITAAHPQIWELLLWLALLTASLYGLRRFRKQK